MKAILSLLLLFGAGHAYAGDSDLAIACNTAMAALEDCAYANKNVSGDQLKAACEKQIKDFIFEYDENDCHSTYKVGGSFLTDRLRIGDAIQDLVDRGRKKDELVKEEADKIRKAEDARKKMYDSVRIK